MFWAVPHPVWGVFDDILGFAMTMAFNEEADREIDDLLGRYPTRYAALIPVLFVAQREFGYLNAETLELVAARLEIPPAKVINTATFYTMLRKKPVGRFHLQVCKNISCYLRGSDDLVACIQDELGIGFGETTDDQTFTLTGVECLASCGTAPVVQVNKDYHESMTPKTLRLLLSELRAQGEDKA
jgi:NADH-quinone oxidoreductase subunit E